MSDRAIKISNNVWWVGAIDRSIRDFHGYSTDRGTTYNAYLIMADKITLVDTVKAPFKNDMMKKISSVVDPKKISYIISNHSEMDHSGSIPEVIKEVNPEKIFASLMGMKALGEHFSMDKEITPVKDGESLNLGSATVTFYETRMIHWPDSMITYLHEDRLIFSQDSFGMHLASDKRFDDEVDAEILECEAKKYFANILTPYSGVVKKFLERLGTLSLPTEMVAPDHGPIWRKDIQKIVNLYHKWAEQRPTKKGVVVFDTMWMSTATMASSVAEGLSSVGAEVKLMPLRTTHRSDVATELLCAGAIVVGSPTINNQIFPTVADLLTYIKGLKFQNLVGTAFGSYGWSGEAVKHIIGHLKDMKVDVAGSGLNIKYVPKDEDLKKCLALGKEIGERLNC